MRRLLWGASGALFLLLLSSLFRVAQLPAAAALFAFVVFAAYRPAPAILTVLALIPIASWTGRQWSGSLAWPETIAVAFLAGYAARKTLERNLDPPDALVYAIHGLIVVIAGSLAVELLFLHATLGGEGLRDVLWQLVARDYFIGDGGFASIDVGMRLIEGLLLAHAGATLAKRSPTLGPQLARALVAGAVMAGALTLWRLWLGAIRADEPVQAFLTYLATLRFHAHYADVNAAGSYYVMALLPALALTLTRRRWALAAAVLAISLSLTGSRAAFVAAPLALGIVWLRTRGSVAAASISHRPLWIGRVAAAVLVIACAGMLYAGVVRNDTPVAVALELRKEFTATAFRMFASRPFFGVGVGDYRKNSTEFSSAHLRAIFPNENAHNNFLQILAEVGAVGFAAFAVLMIMAIRRADRLLSSDVPVVAAGLVAGLLGFVLTCVAGHPLLIDEPALTFWLLLGAAAGWGTAVARDGGSTPTVGMRWIAGTVLLVVAISIPARAQRRFGAANLEHLGIGLSHWQTAADDVRYRTAGATSTVFLPADAAAVAIRLRAMPPDTVLEVQLYLDGRQANAVRVASDMWTVVTVPIPPNRDGHRFRPLELRVASGSPADSALIMVGKVEPR